ncbi:MAG: nickel pincer cofactor biosynthesis protein LarC [Candidatus Micrarchaeota archaeon]
MLILDPSNGVSGDMLLSALVGLGASEKKIKKIAKLVGAKLDFVEVSRGHARAKFMRARGAQKRYSPGEMRRKIKNMRISEWAKKAALKIFDALLRGEARAHGSKHVHFHELGEADTIVDVAGTAVALEDLGEKEVFSLPLALGREAGPAVFEIVRERFPFFMKDTAHELTTPTGAAIITTIAKAINSSPVAKAKRVAYGAGAVEMEEPNVLRAVICDRMFDDDIRVLETNVDDVSGEVLGYAVERLLDEGARDACLIPIIAKKGRPGCILQVMCTKGDVEKFCRIIFEETGTLGIREHSCAKHLLERKTREVDSGSGRARVKVARLGGRVVKMKPEYEDVKKIARKNRLPLRVASENILRRMKK